MGGIRPRIMESQDPWCPHWNGVFMWMLRGDVLYERYGQVVWGGREGLSWRSAGKRAGLGTEGGGSSNVCVSFCGLHVMAQDRDLLGWFCHSQQNNDYFVKRFSPLFSITFHVFCLLLLALCCLWANLIRVQATSFCIVSSLHLFLLKLLWLSLSVWVKDLSFSQLSHSLGLLWSVQSLSTFQANFTHSPAYTLPQYW